MLKSILKLQGAQELDNAAQKLIEGGWIPRSFCHSDADCHYTQTCIGCICSAPGDPV
ncbi:MAG: hypothetical protein ACI9Y7_000150 [Dokdonia sp.]|jgi:hypothetical protein